MEIANFVNYYFYLSIILNIYKGLNLCKTCKIESNICTSCF